MKTSESDLGSWREALPKVCELLANTDTTEVTPGQQALAYQFVAAMFLEGLHSSVDWFEYEEKFDCWDCGMTGQVQKNGVSIRCPECEGRGYKYVYLAPGIRLRFRFGDNEYESLVSSSLLKNYSQRNAFWDDHGTPRPSWRESNFRVVPMRAVAGKWRLWQRPSTTVSVPTAEAFAEVEKVVKARLKEIRRNAAAKAAKTRSSKKGLENRRERGWVG